MTRSVSQMYQSFNHEILLKTRSGKTEKKKNTRSSVFKIVRLLWKLNTPTLYLLIFNRPDRDDIDTFYIRYFFLLRKLTFNIIYKTPHSLDNFVVFNFRQRGFTLNRIRFEIKRFSPTRVYHIRKRSTRMCVFFLVDILNSQPQQRQSKSLRNVDLKIEFHPATVNLIIIFKSTYRQVQRFTGGRIRVSGTLYFTGFGALIYFGTRRSCLVY